MSHNYACEIQGSAIIFHGKLEQPIELYYKAISQMLSLILTGNFDQTFILMPNIKVLKCECRIVHNLKLTKNIMSLTSTSFIVNILPKNMIFLKLRSKHPPTILTKIEVNKNIKYVFFKCPYQYITKLNKSLIQCFWYVTSKSPNAINKKIQHLYLKSKCITHIDLPKKLITLELHWNFNRPIILTPNIRYLCVTTYFDKNMPLEYPIDVLTIFNGTDNFRLVENVPNYTRKRFIKIVTHRKHIVNNMPSDVENTQRRSKFYNDAQKIYSYGFIEKFQNIVPINTNCNSQVQSLLPKINPLIKYFITSDNISPRTRSSPKTTSSSGPSIQFT